MLAEQPAFRGVLESMARNETAGAEIGVNTQQGLCRFLGCIVFAARGQARRKEAQVRCEARVEGSRPPRPPNCLFVVACRVACERDDRVAVEDMRVVGRQPQPDIGAAASFARLANITEGGTAA